MPNNQVHPLDEIGDEVAAWLEEEADYYVKELVGDYRTPFAAKTSETDKLGFYRRAFYQHDNEGNPQYDKPNTKGREEIYNRVSPDQYVQIAKAVGPKGGIEHMKSLGDDELEESDSGYNY